MDAVDLQKPLDFTFPDGTRQHTALFVMSKIWDVTKVIIENGWDPYLSRLSRLIYEVSNPFIDARTKARGGEPWGSGPEMGYVGRFAEALANGVQGYVFSINGPVSQDEWQRALSDEFGKIAQAYGFNPSN